MDNILITGGTGALGREIIEQLLNADRQISVITTKDNVNLPVAVNVVKADITDPESIQEIVDHSDIIIHCASNPPYAQFVDLEGSRNLLSAVNKSKIKHFIYVSIAGVDNSEFSYYKIKYEVELLIGSLGIPFTILRATQFHDFVLNRMIKPYDIGTCLKVPAGLKFQSIEISEVAQKIVDLTFTGPKNGTVIIGGPQILTIEKMGQTYLDIWSKKYKLETEIMEGERFDMLRSGINLCKEHTFGIKTWEQFLTKLLNNDNL
ncbi:MAG: NAD(P)H-binding protein [Bacteroidota bacterium]